ncbi:MAG: flap endonuclease-1 [Thaumarchaeota archaeon]|nr:flap endonuclease-1 [Nitrososphaerota archaeon]
MGVDLRDIVKPKKTTLEHLSGRTVAVDAYNALYQFLSIIRGETGEPLMDSEGKITSHLSGLFYRNLNLLTLGIRPVYVLDGKPPELKRVEIERRRAARQEAIVMYERALERGDLESAKRYASATSVMKDYMIADTKKILNLLGIPYIEAPSEGEATAAELCQKDIVSDVASQDYDSLLFGAKRLIRNLTISGRRKLPGKNIFINLEPEEIELQTVLSELQISREQLIDIAILLGTDFNPDGFEKVGPKTALKYIKTYGRLEKIPQLQEQLNQVNYDAIRAIFLRPEVSKISEIKWNRPNIEGIVNFLCGQKGFSEERVRSALQKLEKREESKSESLEKWFA